MQKKEQGFSLIEILISLAIVSMALVGVYTLQSNSIKQAELNLNKSLMLVHATDLKERYWSAVCSQNNTANSTYNQEFVDNVFSNFRDEVTAVGNIVHPSSHAELLSSNSSGLSVVDIEINLYNPTEIFTTDNDGNIRTVGQNEVFTFEFSVLSDHCN